MATDRTKEEQQAINYAFDNDGTWAILTNFEKLRLFNARRDWLVLSFERPSAYLDEFDLLWQLSYDSVLQRRAGPAEQPAPPRRRRHRLSGLHQRVARAAGAGHRGPAGRQSVGFLPDGRIDLADAARGGPAGPRPAGGGPLCRGPPGHPARHAATACTSCARTTPTPSRLSQFVRQFIPPL